MKYLFFVSLLFSSLTYAQCKLKEDSVQLQWTGFKFTEKSPVSGTFTKAKLSQTKEVVSLDIDTTSVNTKNPARDNTLRMAFFRLFNPTKSLKVTVPNELVKNSKKGIMKVDTGNKSFDVPVEVKREGNQYKLSGTFDLKEVGHTKAWESIHKMCRALHTGKDGVSKTWTQIDVSATVDIAGGC